MFHICMYLTLSVITELYMYQIEVRSLKRIQYDVLETDLIGVNIDSECTDVNLVVCQYDVSLSSLLDKHAPSKRIYVV